MTIERVLAAVATHRDEAPIHAMHRDYFNGLHRYSFASPKFRQTYGWVLRAAIENLCPAVVYAHVDRLSVESWGDNIDEAAAHGLSRLANLVHTEAHVTGNGFAITWYKPGTKDPMAVFHRAEQVVPFVNAEQPDVLDAIAKLWIDPSTGRGRMNLYDGQRLARWVTAAPITHVSTPERTTIPSLPDAASGWQEYDTEDARHEEGHEFGATPAVWWKRNAPSQFEPGVSILRDVVSPQNRLNKVIADAVVSGERIAMPTRYVLDVAEEQLRARLNPATGLMEPPKLPFDEALNTILAMSAKGPAGQFEGPNAEHLIKMKNDLESEIARVTGVPSYYLAQTSGDVPSGESLRVVTSRLVSAVTTFQQDATPAWKGQLELLGFESAAIKWADPMPMDEAERVTIAEAKQRMGYALEDVIGDLELDPEGIVGRATEAAETRMRDRQQIGY